MQGLCHPINGPGTPPGQGFGNANAPLRGVAGTVSGQFMVVQVVTIGDAVRRPRGVSARECVAVMATGQVRCNIASPRVLIQDGARIRGRIDMSVDEVRPDCSGEIDNAA